MRSLDAAVWIVNVCCMIPCLYPTADMVRVLLQWRQPGKDTVFILTKCSAACRLALRFPTKKVRSFFLLLLKVTVCAPHPRMRHASTFLYSSAFIMCLLCAYRITVHNG